MTNKKHLEEQDNVLNITKPALFFVGLAIIVAILFFILHSYNQIRQQQVYDRYAEETQEYIKNNQEGLEVIYTDVFQDSVCAAYSNEDLCTEEEIQNGCNLTPLCKEANEKRIYELLSTDLTDFSSTQFIKQMNGELYVMRLSGDIERYYQPGQNDEHDIERLLEGQVDTLPWENYSYDFQSKEVVIAVKNADGEILGAIMRGVIE